MKIFTVRSNGVPIKHFASAEEAQNFLINWSYDQCNQQMRFNLIDEAVERSDMKDAQTLINRIMEMK
jgi:hypothetical protein